MAKRPTAPPVDAAVIADLAELFGRERLATLLVGLGDEIAARLDPPSGDRQRLAGDVHALVSVSGTLGFTTLSQACLNLEAACLDGRDTAPPVAEVVRAGIEARSEIARLRDALA